VSAQAFWSRLSLVGDFVLDTPLRISTQNVGIAIDGEGRPIIPGSTFRGALRSYIESVLRGVYDESQNKRQSVTLRGPDGRGAPISRIVKLCCDSVDKRQDDLNYQGCLTTAIVAKWQADPLLRPNLDVALVDCSCQVCRLFGAPWLAGKVFMSDMQARDWNGAIQTRAGMAISRDRDTAIEGSQYQRQSVPPGTHFGFQLSAENVSPVEQGLILLGLRAFEVGLVGLGADRTRGLGYGRLAIDWWNCRYVDSSHLIGALLGADTQAFTESDADARLNALNLFLSKP
jgi:CRISPR-associated RAMP protein (TIGR02581 family)